MNTKEVFIPLNTPSSKNSKIATSKGVFHSKTVMNYLRALGIQHFSSSRKEVKGYVKKPNLFLQAFKDWEVPNEQNYPIKVGFHFVRNSRRPFDYINVLQVVMDLMVAHKLIEDDDMNHILPFPMERDGKYYTIDKENPGVYIKILE